MSESHLRDGLLIYSSLIYTTSAGDVPAHCSTALWQALLQSSPPLSLPSSSFTHSSSFSHFSSPSSLVLLSLACSLSLLYLLYFLLLQPSSPLMLADSINPQLEVSNSQRKEGSQLKNKSGRRKKKCSHGKKACANMCVWGRGRGQRSTSNSFFNCPLPIYRPTDRAATGAPS